MNVVCDSCGKNLAKVDAVARLILTVHCAYCGKDFGVAVDPAISADEPSSPTAKETVAGA